MAFPTKRPTALEGGATHQPLIDPSLPIVGGFGYVAPCKSFVGRPIKMASDYAGTSLGSSPASVGRTGSGRVPVEILRPGDAARGGRGPTGGLVLCMRCKVGFGRQRCCRASNFRRAATDQPAPRKPSTAEFMPNFSTWSIVWKMHNLKKFTPRRRLRNRSKLMVHQ